ncbi:unnamed protein product [Pelagomonas calceolata]|uniref:Uncharacterized protein n=1 Tax=Pelagomonas calceolata TaxID=35677 RepID=A0A8J2SAV1_9STRA|nr:unnamed protein product [Pelagomonas calceolata]
MAFSAKPYACDTLASSNIAASASSSSSVSPALTRDHASTATSGGIRRGPSSAWNSSTKHCVGGRSSSQSLVVPPWPTGPRSVAFGSCALLSRRGFGGGRGLFVASSGVPVGGGGGSGTACSASGAAVSAGGVGGGGSTGGGGDCEGGGASVGGGGDCGSASGGGAERAASSRFCRWRRATFFHARRHRATSMTRRSSLAMALPTLAVKHGCGSVLSPWGLAQVLLKLGQPTTPALSASNGFELDYFFRLA